MSAFARLGAAFAALMCLTGGAYANQPVTLVLNWTPTADHSPYYYAKDKGWYAKAGIDLTIEIGKGSAVSAEKVGTGQDAFGVADLPTALVARSKGADVVAVMSVYANTPQEFYWLKSSGIRGPKDFPGHSIGNPPGDASRVMWPAFAKAVGIDPKSVKFVNISPQAKLPALKSHAVDIISDFYNEHDLKLKAFGANLGFVNWKDVGLNLYGNALVVNGAFMKKHPKLVSAFVKISQKAFAACVADVHPCLKSLLNDASGLKMKTQLNQWERIKQLMTDKFATTKALGWIDAARMQHDYTLVKTYLGLQKPFAVKSAFTDRFLDTSIKMDASKVRH